MSNKFKLCNSLGNAPGAMVLILLLTHNNNNVVKMRCNLMLLVGFEGRYLAVHRLQ